MLNLKSLRQFSKQIGDKLPRKYKFEIYKIYKSSGSYFLALEALTTYTKNWLFKLGFLCDRKLILLSENYSLKWLNNNTILITDYTSIKENNFKFKRDLNDFRA